jgi:hypothetical protein
MRRHRAFVVPRSGSRVKHMNRMHQNNAELHTTEPFWEPSSCAASQQLPCCFMGSEGLPPPRLFTLLLSDPCYYRPAIYV